MSDVNDPAIAAVAAERERLAKILTTHPRLSVQLWTGQYWETLTLYNIWQKIEALDPVPQWEFNWSQKDSY